jgi:Transcription elongation factor, GreA/GreB, C-term
VTQSGPRALERARDSQQALKAAVVAFGSHVTLPRGDNRRQTFRIVGEEEAETHGGLIAYLSPACSPAYRKGRAVTLSISMAAKSKLSPSSGMTVVGPPKLIGQGLGPRAGSRAVQGSS